MTMPAVTVVIATIATREKTPTLLRALDAVRSQDIPCSIIVVANGPRRDKDLVAALKRSNDVEVLELEEGNLVTALTKGVAAVRTEYFCVLDDDDVFTHDACRKRFEYMEAHPEADVLVTPGIKQYSGGRTEPVPARLDVTDPLTSLFDCNWLPSCGAVYRRPRIGPDYFASMPRYLEWTYLALRLAHERRVHFWSTDAAPHFTIFETPGSESQGLSYVLALPGNIARLHDPTLPEHIRRLLSDRMARAFHDAAAHCLDAGRLGDAWRFHFKSLCDRHGIRYLPFTRRLFFESLKSGFRTQAD